MTEPSPTVVAIVMQRVAFVFGVPIEALALTSRFGSDLSPSTVSDFTENELDQILGDVQEVREGSPRVAAVLEEVRTIGDLCELVGQFQLTNPAACDQLLKRWEKEQDMDKRPLWRRALFRALGL
jgi:hypothetical protein